MLVTRTLPLLCGSTGRRTRIGEFVHFSELRSRSPGCVWMITSRLSRLKVIVVSLPLITQFTLYRRAACSVAQRTKTYHCPCPSMVPTDRNCIQNALGVIRTGSLGFRTVAHLAQQRSLWPTGSKWSRHHYSSSARRKTFANTMPCSRIRRAFIGMKQSATFSFMSSAANSQSFVPNMVMSYLIRWKKNNRYVEIASMLLSSTDTLT